MDDNTKCFPQSTLPDVFLWVQDSCPGGSWYTLLHVCVEMSLHQVVMRSGPQTLYVKKAKPPTEAFDLIQKLRVSIHDSRTNSIYRYKLNLGIKINWIFLLPNSFLTLKHRQEDEMFRRLRALIRALLCKQLC